jgi:hypothetical protein
MFERFSRTTMTATAAALLAALGVGGAALAQSGSPTPQVTPPAAADTAGSATNEAPGTETNDATDKADATDANDKADANEPADKAEAPGSETAADDGPGGHADEAGAPAAK